MKTLEDTPRAKKAKALLREKERERERERERDPSRSLLFVLLLQELNFLFFTRLDKVVVVEAETPWRKATIGS